MFLIEGKNSKILTDPWITYNNNSRSGLYNFPKLNLNKSNLEKINPDLIYISHTHADHFDPDTFNVFKQTPQVLENIEVKDKNIIDTFNCKKAIKKASELIKGRGRLLVRKSGTEPKIRIMAESHDKNLILRCIKIIRKSIKIN